MRHLRGAGLATAAGLGQPSEHQKDSKEWVRSAADPVNESRTRHRPMCNVAQARAEGMGSTLLRGHGQRGCGSQRRWLRATDVFACTRAWRCFPHTYWGHLSSEQSSYASKSEDCGTNIHICLLLKNKHPCQLQISSAVLLTGWLTAVEKLHITFQAGSARLVLSKRAQGGYNDCNKDSCCPLGVTAVMLGHSYRDKEMNSLPKVLSKSQIISLLLGEGISIKLIALLCSLFQLVQA